MENIEIKQSYKTLSDILSKILTHVKKEGYPDIFISLIQTLRQEFYTLDKSIAEKNLKQLKDAIKSIQSTMKYLSPSELPQEDTFLKQLFIELSMAIEMYYNSVKTEIIKIKEEHEIAQLDEALENALLKNTQNLIMRIFLITALMVGFWFINYLGHTLSMDVYLMMGLFTVFGVMGFITSFWMRKNAILKLYKTHRKKLGVV